MLAHLHPTPYRFTSKSRSVPRLRIIRCVRLCVRVAPVPNPPSAHSPFARFKVLPLPGPDRLAVRIEQLTAGRLALPKIRSLFGCTAKPDPYTLDDALVKVAP